MANPILPQPSFAAGEVAPDLFGRIDQALYQIGLRSCYNFMVRPYGGVQNRMGTYFINDARYSDRATRLYQFQFNELQTYILEFGHQYMRVIRDGGHVVEPSKAITGATAANPVVITSNGHGYSNGDDVYITGVSGMVQLNGRTFRVAGATTNTFQLHEVFGTGVTVNGTGYNAYVSGGTLARIYTVATPWADTELPEISSAQSADVLTVCHHNRTPRDITRLDHDNWTVSLFNYMNGPFKDVNTNQTSTIYASAQTGSVTLTSSTALFNSLHVGSYFYLEQKNDDGTRRWEVNVGVLDGQIRRRGINYYQHIVPSPTSASISDIRVVGATGDAFWVIDLTGPSSFVAGDYIYVSNVQGRWQFNERFFKIRTVSGTGNALFVVDPQTGAELGVGFSDSAYTSGGTVVRAGYTGSVPPDHTEGQARDGDPGALWEYLHSGFGVVRITAVASSTSATATVVKRIPAGAVGSGNASFNWAMGAWNNVEGFPSACTYHKQRMVFGGTRMQPNRLFFSGVGLRTDFTRSRPVEADQALNIALDTTEQVNAVRSLINLSELIVLTGATEILVNGENNIISATSPPYARVQGYNGASRVPPIIIGNTALFVQDVGSVVRSLQYQLDSDSFTGIDMTARSPHLFRRRKIVQWAFQRHPHSVIWCIMSDGALLGFTFLEEQQVYAWHRHGTDGEYESVATVREGDETACYLVVRRMVNGHLRRMIERFSTREFASISDAHFVDSGRAYDGRNYGSTTVTVTGGTTWDSPEVLTLTSSAGIFSATDVGNEIVFWDGTIALRLVISAVTSGTVASAIPTKMLPPAWRNVARADWAFGRSRFTNLFHLEGKAVSVLADGNVVEGLSISGGELNLPYPATVVHVGLGYESHIETLDILGPSGQLKGRNIAVPRVFFNIQESRSLFVGTQGPDGQFYEVKERTPPMGYDAPITPQTSLIEVLTGSTWSNKGRVIAKTTKPLPMTINSIDPEVAVGTS